MKKVISIISIILVFFIIYFLQLNFFSWFNISGIKPNVFIILILFIGLFMNKNIACIAGFIMGIYLELLTSKQIGISAVVYAGIGYICGYLDKSFSKESKITIIGIVAGSTVVYELLNYIYGSISNNVALELFGFFKILVVEVLFNILITIILYPLIKSAGNVVERIFKTQKITTGYILSR